MRSKLFITAIILTMSFAFASCGNTDTSNDSSSSSKSESTSKQETKTSQIDKLGDSYIVKVEKSEIDGDDEFFNVTVKDDSYSDADDIALSAIKRCYSQLDSKEHNPNVTGMTEGGDTIFIYGADHDYSKISYWDEDYKPYEYLLLDTDYDYIMGKDVQ